MNEQDLNKLASMVNDSGYNGVTMSDATSYTSFEAMDALLEEGYITIVGGRLYTQQYAK